MTRFSLLKKLNFINVTSGSKAYNLYMIKVKVNILVNNLRKENLAKKSN